MPPGAGAGRRPSKPLLVRPTTTQREQRKGGLLSTPVEKQKTYPSLLNPGKQTLIPPADQAKFLATDPAKTPAKAIAAVEHGLAKTKNPEQRALAAKQVAAAGFSLDPIQSGIGDALRRLSSVKRTNIIGGFPSGSIYTNPSVKAIIYATAKANGNPLPPNASDADMLKAISQGKRHSNGYWGLLTNFPRDVVQSPIYAYQGGFALGHATNRLLHGDTAPIKEVAAQQLDVLRHPGAFAQEHPFQAGLTVASVLKGAGAVAGRATAAAETPRVLVNQETGLALDRGVLSRNLYDRTGQLASDKLMQSRLPGAAGRPAEILRAHAAKMAARIEHQNVQLEGMAARRAHLEPVVKAGKGISRSRQAQIIYNHGLGSSTPEMIAYYEGVGGKLAGKQAKLRGAQLQRFTDTLSSKEQAFLGAVKAAAEGRTQMLLSTRTPAGAAALHPYSAARVEYGPLAKVKAQQGDPAASAFLAADENLAATPLTSPEYAAAQSGAQGALDAFKQAHAAAGGEAPMRVPFVGPRVKNEYGFSGKSVRANTNPKAYVSGLGKRSEFKNFQFGNYLNDPKPFFKQLLEPHTAADAIKFVNRLGENRAVARPGVPLEPIPPDLILRNVSNLRTTPNVKLSAAGHLDEATAADLAGKDVLAEFDPNAKFVPADGNYQLYSRAAYNEITKKVARPTPNIWRDVANAGTQVFRHGVLFTRPAYPLTNLVGNLTQNAIGGVGPLSYARALSGKYNYPVGVTHTGAIATDLKALAEGHLGDAWAEFKQAPTPATRAVATAKILGMPLTTWMNGIRGAAIEIDNVSRKANFLKTAVPGARKLAHPRDSHATMFAAKFKGADAATKQVIDAVAKGDHAGAEILSRKAVTKVNDLLGNYGAMGSGPALDLAVPFHRWARFSTRLLLATLPVKYPGTLLLVDRLGALGQQGQAQMGVFSTGQQGSIPLGSDGPLQMLLGTQKANPFATPFQLQSPDERKGESTGRGAINMINPLATGALGAITGHDPFGHQLTNGIGLPITKSIVDRARYIVNRLAQFGPPLTAVSNQDYNAPDTSIPVFGEQAAVGTPSADQQPKPSIIDNLINQTLPLRINRVALRKNEHKGISLMKDALAKEFKAEFKARAQRETAGMTPQEAAAYWKRYSAKATTLGRSIATNYRYYQAHPDELQRVIAEGLR